MGNISTRPATKKLELIQEEFHDFSANVTSNIIAEARQNIVVNQEQNVVLKNIKLDGCKVGVQQEAQVLASQIATFKVFLSNPKQVLKSLTSGPKSVFGQAFASSSQLMKDFLTSARQAYQANDDSQLRQKLTSIIKMNISQQAILRATQQVMVNQTQNIFVDGLSCKDGELIFKQSAAVEATQNVMMQIVMNALNSDPTFRRAVRQFNGDYNSNLTDEEIDKGVKMPEVCFKDLLPSNRSPTCAECEDCPVCPSPPPCDLQCPECNDYVLNASLLYGVLGGAFLLLLLTMILKRNYRR